MNKKILFKNYTLLNQNEHKELLDIRNERTIREVSLNSDFIDFSSHITWVETLKTSNDKDYFAIIVNDEIIGAMNIFDINKKLKWGVFFKDNSSLIIKSFTPIYFIDYVFSKFKVDEIYAEVKNENLNALSYNKNLGFQIVEENKFAKTLTVSKNSFFKLKDNKMIKRIIKKMNEYEFILKEKEC